MLQGFQPNDIKTYTKEQLEALAGKLRKVIFDTVTANGGHLASNLGVVETIVALCYTFDFPNDKIVFDVGHQCYPYKLLTGRYDRFNTLRQKDGIAGFPKRKESEYDCYDTGHAGTALSVALGIAKARDLKGENFDVIAFVGDGSFNNGLIYEALNSLKILNTRVLLVLNDNGMSISPTVGGMHDILSGIQDGDRGEKIKLLESFSLDYVGVKDGNDVEEMLSALREAKNRLQQRSVLLHIVTKKGKGYEFSEEHPCNSHGVSKSNDAQEVEYSAVFGKCLQNMARKDDRIVAVTAAMTDSLGLSPFFEEFPSRAFDVSICEENACVLASAMATQGLKPYYAIYSTFLQRSFDEIVHDVAMQDLPVTFCIDRAGISGADGETHQGVFDISYLSLIPNIAIVAPKDLQEFEDFLEFSRTFEHPLAIRYPRSGKLCNSSVPSKIEQGKWEYLHQTDSSKATVIGCGERSISIAKNVRKRLHVDGIEVDIINGRFIKPLDEKMLSSLKTSLVLTIEDNVKKGGFGEAVQTYLTENNPIPCKVFGYKDAFIKQGCVSELQKEYGVNEEEIYAYVKEKLV